MNKKEFLKIWLVVLGIPVFIQGCSEMLELGPDNSIVRGEIYSVALDQYAIKTGLYHTLQELVEENFILGELRGDLVVAAKGAFNNKDYMELWYHPGSKIVHHKMKKILPNGGHKELLSTGADYMEKYGAIKWLSDDRDMIVVKEEDYKWADEEWWPRVLKAGFKYWAIVKPTNSVFGNMQMKRFVREYRDRGVIVEMFNSVEAALEWLESK